jgi:hypothetical protein
MADPHVIAQNPAGRRGVRPVRSRGLHHIDVLRTRHDRQDPQETQMPAQLVVARAPCLFLLWLPGQGSLRDAQGKLTCSLAANTSRACNCVP